MKMKNHFFLTLSLAVTFSSLAQLEELTPQEINYRDSISALNLKNEAQVDMKLIDLSGKVMAARNYGSINGTWSVNLNTANLNAGVYLVELTIDGTRVIKRLTIE